MMGHLHRYLTACGLALLLWGAPAAAQDRLIESMIPEAVAQVMREEGYTAELKKAEDGTRYMSVKRDKWTFNVNFYACDLVKGCESLQFYTWYKRNPGDTLERINEWNAGKRFMKVAIDKDGDLEATMDVSLLGKMTRANLADVLDWWDVMTAEMIKFFPDPVDGKAPAAADKPGS